MNEEQREFMNWLLENYPETYTATMLEVGGSGGLQAAHTKPDSGGGWWNKIVSAVETIAPKLIQAKAQRSILKTQLQRARQGLPPLDTRNLSPVIRIQPELPYGTASAIKRYVLPGLAIGGGLLILLMFINKRKSKR